jgi:exopolysaccharide biosynthesis polyprenyl glycosylphosphotransferase
MLIGRILARAYARGRTDFREPTLIVGAGKVGLSVARKLALRPRYGLDVIGFLDDEPLEEQGDGPPHLGSVRRLDQVIRAYGVERVIIAFSRLKTDELVEISRQCMDMGVQVDIVPRMYEVIGSRNVVHYLDGMPLLGLRTPRLSRSSRLIKRSFDLAVAAPILFALSPLFLFVAWRIKATSSGPVFFRQERMGAGGKRFRIWKFRTMYVDADARKAEVAHMNVHTESGPKMFKILDDPRITPIGASLRKWSIDEMPQLINVLRGEMSLVGPRPLILDEDQHIVGSKRRRLDLTPGITGLWQVVGRSDVPFAEMIALDYLYVTNWSLLGDIKLLSQTLPAVLQRRGAY